MIQFALVDRSDMTLSVLVKIQSGTTAIYLSIDEAQSLRDFLVSEQSVTPIEVESKTKRK